MGTKTTKKMITGPEALWLEKIKAFVPGRDQAHIIEPGRYRIALDTETTGVNLFHGCKPYFVSTVDSEKVVRCWEWPVDPTTREPIIPYNELHEISEFLLIGPKAFEEEQLCDACGEPLGSMICESLPHHEDNWITDPVCTVCGHHHKPPAVILHNAKFDMRAMSTVGIKLPEWEDVFCTHIASHVVDSRGPHGLKPLCMDRYEIEDDDQEMLKAKTNAARSLAQIEGVITFTNGVQNPGGKWRIANPGDPHFPSKIRAPKDGWWTHDTWLPKAVALAKGYPETHPFHWVAKRYAAQDAERTYVLSQDLFQEIEEAGLVEQYEWRRSLLKATYDMEEHGITIHVPRIEQMIEEHSIKAEEEANKCKKLCKRPDINLASPKQIQEVLYGGNNAIGDGDLEKINGFALMPLRRTKDGYAVDKDTLNTLLESMKHEVEKVNDDPGGYDPEEAGRIIDAHDFIESLLLSRKYTKSVDYMESYLRAGLDPSPKIENKVRILPEWLRLHPNFNVAETATTRFSSNDPNAQNISKKEGSNIRYVFGPLEGREWYSIDYSNVELRIFAQASGDQSLIDAFAAGESVHLIFCRNLWPELYEECLREGKSFKDVYASTYYQWAKNGTFSLIYGAGEEKADKTYHLKGAYNDIRRKMPLIDSFMQEKKNEARELGYVTTLGGYRLKVPHNMPHVPVNYFVQGTAGWCIVKSMVRIHKYLQKYPQHQNIMTIHDELVFDFPIDKRNDRIIRDIADIMVYSGDELGVHTPVEVKRIKESWADGETLKW